MKHITILVPEGDNNLSSITGTYKILMRANGYQKERGGSIKFYIQLAGLSASVSFKEGLFSVQPHVTIGEIKKTDLIIIPSLSHNFEAAIQANWKITDWIIRQRLKGAAIASICTGAFLLAATGLLEGKRCSTHWAFHDAFQELFPDVILCRDKIITDEDGIYTNGGAYSFLHLNLYLVEKYFDRETAIFCSKVFQIEMDREYQSPFIIFSKQKAHDDETIRQAQLYLEQHVDEQVSMERLAARFSVSRRNFDRRFIKATGSTPGAYFQRLKIESAKKAFETSTKNISEVMYATGYTDPYAFRELFKKVTGLSPSAYRSRYNKSALNDR